MPPRDSRDNEDDVVEMKKAIATGSAKDGAGVSSGVYTYLVLQRHDRAQYGFHSRYTVPPIVCYCLASILMTVVNKVIVVFNHDFTGALA